MIEPKETIKWSFVTHVVPIEAIAGWEKRPDAPRIGDVGLHRVVTLGKHTRMDNRESRVHYLLPGDLVATVYGNRYATDQYEGYVPPASEQYHMLSIGGVCGMVATKNTSMPDPTILEFVGFAIDAGGKIVNLRDYRMKPISKFEKERSFKTILSVGASMNSGKTTSAAMAIRGLTKAGFRVAAGHRTDGRGVRRTHPLCRPAPRKHQCVPGGHPHAPVVLATQSEAGEGLLLLRTSGGLGWGAARPGRRHAPGGALCGWAGHRR